MSYAEQDVELQDVLELFIREALLKTNCHAIGEITKFDKDTQTCEIKISYDRRYSIPQANGTIKNEARPYPLLADVPLIQMTGGKGGIAFPVEAGDSCVVLFNDRDMDNWFSGKREGVVKTKRIHSLSDGLAIVGPRDSKNSSSEYEDNKLVIYYDKTKIKLGSKITIENELYDLKTLMVELVTSIKAIVTQGGPTTQEISPASQAALEAVSLKLQGLLE